jgi:Entner-Doudoroff aldolase
MDDSDWFDQAFDKRPLMAILRGFDSRRTVELAERAWDLGMDWVEVPIQSSDALDALVTTIEAGRARGRTVGAGTVTTLERVGQAADAGAAFTVAPGLDTEVAIASAEAGLPHLPGVATPSDIQAANRIGLRWVKAFPAATLGPAWFRAMRGPLPETRFVATGGVDAGNAQQFLDAGAHVVAVGSALEDPGQLDKLAALLPAARS